MFARLQAADVSARSACAQLRRLQCAILVIMDILTSSTIWENYDPEREALDVNVFKRTVSGGIVEESLFYTGRTLPHGKSRIHAVVCSSEKGSAKPAVLVIGNYSEPIDMDCLRDLARNGFVAMGVDLMGKRPFGVQTLYTDELDHCNDERHSSIFDMSQGVYGNRLYEYALCCRRAITYLCSRSDATSISVITAGKGAYVGMIVLGVETRVKSAAVLFGSIYRDYPETKLAGEPYDDDSLKQRLDLDAIGQNWINAFAPQTYAFRIGCPIYVVISANSRYVNLYDTNRTFSRLNEDSRLLILPTCVDYLPKKYASGVVQWLKGATAPRVAEVKAQPVSSGVYRLQIGTDHPIDKTEFWYCTDDEPYSGNWQRAAALQGEDCYFADVQLNENGSKIAAFAIQEGAVTLSSRLMEQDLLVSNVRKANSVIYSGNSGQILLPLCNEGSRWSVNLEPKLAKGALNIVGAQGRSLATFAIDLDTDASFTVGFDVCCALKQQLTVTVVCGFGAQNEEYSQTVVTSGSNKWERFTFDKENFHRVTDGKPLAAKRVDMISVTADSDFIVNNIFLV